MGCPEKCYIEQNLIVSVTSHDPTTGAVTDCDTPPTYRVYEDETAAAILTGALAKLDDANTTGFYTETIAATAANGFEDGKSYTIYIEATVGGVVGAISYAFKIEYDVAKADWSIDTTTTPWQLVCKRQGSATEIFRKSMLDIDGNNITAESVTVGQHVNV